MPEEVLDEGLLELLTEPAGRNGLLAESQTERGVMKHGGLAS